MGAAQQCRSEACKPVAPVWARIAGASPSSTVDDWGPAECAAFVEGNAGGSIEIPSKLPFIQTGYTITSQNCGALVANWAIAFGLTSEAECMTRCDLPGCESTDPAAGCAAPPPPAPKRGSCVDVDCGAHGSCSGGTCVCESGAYTGDRCQSFGENS